MTEPLRKCCMGCGGTTKQFFEMPLSMYVLLSIASAGYFSVTAMSAVGTPPCEGSNFLNLIMAFSAIYAVFSVYVQCRVWGTIVGDGVFPESKDPWSGKTFKERIDEYSREQEAKATKLAAEGGSYLDQSKGLLNKAANKGREAAGVATAEANEAPEAPARDKDTVPQEVVQQAFRTVFMEDLGVLVMFVALCGMVFVGMKGPSLIDADSKCKGGGAESAPLAYFGLSTLFAFAYMCCSCCSKSVSIAKQEPEE